MELMQSHKLKIADIYVPAKLRRTLDPKKAEGAAQRMLEAGQETPILVRRDEGRFVLVEGIHRLEACKALGETTIVALIVQARRN
jgi:ParB-like chromosome segregation protein Spo0J